MVSSTAKKKNWAIVGVAFLATVFISMASYSEAYATSTYNDVFASSRGSGYSLSQAKASESTSFSVGDFAYVWAYLHDGNGSFYKSYGPGTCNLTLSFFKPDGTCAHTYTYNDSDNNWIGHRLDVAGTWKIQSKVTGALSGTNTQTITVKATEGGGQTTEKNWLQAVTPGKAPTVKSDTGAANQKPSGGTSTAKPASTKTPTATKTKTAKRSNGGISVYNIAKSQVGKKYSSFAGYGFHWRAWCADFVSWCAKKAGQSKAIPKSSSVSDIRSAIKKAKGKEYSKSKIKSGAYVPQKGDIVIFKSSGASHVGIVSHAKYRTIYYVDGNNTTYGNGYRSRVCSSKRSYSHKELTCVLHPNYR